MPTRLLLLASIAALALAQPAAEAMRKAAAGDFASAEEILSKAVRASPRDAELRYRLGTILLRRKKPAEALPHLEAAAKRSPMPAVWLALAHARLENGRLPEARAAAGKARTPGASNVDFARALGGFYCQLAAASRTAGDAAGAVDAWQEAIDLAPDDPALYSALAELFLEHRTPAPAVAVLSTAAARFPENAGLAGMLGLAHYSAGETDKALDAFLRAMDLAPDEEASYSTIETLLPAAGYRLPAIEQRLRQFVDRHPRSPVGHFLLAQAIEAAAADSPEIEQHVREAIRVEPQFWPAHYALHKPLVARNEFRKAAETLERAAALHPEYAPAHYALAQVYASLGDRARSGEERKRHHELVTREREAAQARNAAMPQLPYRLRNR
jgi:tetratricopeptide (TPR) repeat protein